LGDETIISQLMIQVTGVIATGLYTAIASYILFKLVDAVLGLRVSVDEETEGLDLTQHNERGYDL
jgi:Amt family ammonium transporter